MGDVGMGMGMGLVGRYVHRVGRTARAGKRGAALTFVGERDKALLKAMVSATSAPLLAHR